MGTYASANGFPLITSLHTAPHWVDLRDVDLTTDWLCSLLKTGANLGELRPSAQPIQRARTSITLVFAFVLARLLSAETVPATHRRDRHATVEKSETRTAVEGLFGQGKANRRAPDRSCEF